MVYLFSIGAQFAFAYKFSIDGHILRVIATDGIETNFEDVEYIVVHSGERYDFLLDTNNNNTRLHYWIRAETLEVDLPPDTEHSARAILTYGNSSVLDWRDGYAGVEESRHQCSSDTPCRVLNCPFEGFGTGIGGGGGGSGGSGVGDGGSGGASFRCISLIDLTPVKSLNISRLPRFPP